MEEISNEYSITCTILDKIVAHMGERHLEFGCGKGNWAYQLGIVNPNAKIIGYDICAESIYWARNRRSRKNVVFTHSLDVLANSMTPFYSASLLFVYHETDGGLLEAIHGLVMPGSRLVVLDYNMKGASEERFRRLFSSDAEKAELQRYDFDDAFRLHTAKSLDDCVFEGEHAGFRTVETEILWNKYFKWVGEKVSPN